MTIFITVIAGIIACIVVGNIAYGAGKDAGKKAQRKLEPKTEEAQYGMKQHRLASVSDIVWSKSQTIDYIRDLTDALKTVTPDSLIEVNITLMRDRGTITYPNRDYRLASRTGTLKSLLKSKFSVTEPGFDAVTSLTIDLIEVIEPEDEPEKEVTPDEMKIIEELRALEGRKAQAKKQREM